MRPINKDTLPHLFGCAFNLLRQYRDTWLCRSFARWWGVQLGGPCTFCGLTFFRRHPYSKIKIGKGCVFVSASWYNPVGLNRRCRISTISENAFIEIKSDCGFSGTVITSTEKILIGERVRCGANVTITDTDWHPVDKYDRNLGKPPKTAPVIIENDVWLGLNVTVLKGVTIGKGTVVGAHSLVTGDLPEHVFAAGIPAKVIKKQIVEQHSLGILDNADVSNK